MSKPNGFVFDPPLEKKVNRGVELGLVGEFICTIATRVDELPSDVVVLIEFNTLKLKEGLPPIPLALYVVLVKVKFGPLFPDISDQVVPDPE